MAISFKSVGKTQVERKQQELSSSIVPIGIKTPLRLGTVHGILEMNTSLAMQVHDNLRNLLQTNFGERLNQYDFGANLHPLVSEFVSQNDFDSQAIERIKAAVSRWMPYVDLEDFESFVNQTQNKNTAIMRIVITYNIPSLQVKKKKLEITLFVM